MHILDLSQEILQEIFCYSGNFLQCALVCKQWISPSLRVRYRNVKLNCGSFHETRLQLQLDPDKRSGFFKYGHVTKKIQFTRFYCRDTINPNKFSNRDCKINCMICRLDMDEFISLLECLPNLKELDFSSFFSPDKYLQYIVETTSNNCLNQLQAMKPLGLYEELKGLLQTKGFLIAYKYRATITSAEFKYCSIMMELGSRLDKSLNFLGELKNLTYLTLYNSCDFNLTTLDLQRLCPNLKGINYVSHILIPDKMIREQLEDLSDTITYTKLEYLKITVPSIPLHYTRYLTNLLSKQVANLEIVISKAYIFDWINEIGLTDAFEFALAVGAIEDFSINFALDRNHDQQSREYDSENGLSRLESFFVLVLAFRGHKNKWCSFTFRDAAACPDETFKFFGSENILDVQYSLEYEEFWDPDTDVFCMHSLNNTTLRSGFNMINDFSVSILGGLDRGLAFKFMEFVIAECSNVSSFEYVDIHRSVETISIMEEYDLSKPDDDTATSTIQKRMNSLSIETAILEDFELDQISQYFPCIVKILCNHSFTDCVESNEIEIDVTSFKHLKSLTYFVQSSQKGQYYAFVQCIHTNGDKVYHHLDKKTPATINPCTSKFFEDCLNNHKLDIYITTIYCRSDVEILLKLSQY